MSLDLILVDVRSGRRRTFPLSSRPTLLGRGVDCDVVLAGATGASVWFWKTHLSELGKAPTDLSKTGDGAPTDSDAAPKNGDPAGASHDPTAAPGNGKTALGDPHDPKHDPSENGAN